MCNIAVAPLVGAWIEIHGLVANVGSMKVAPLVGAWIEILESDNGNYGIVVAPLVGAWIEILRGGAYVLAPLSLLSWERGLKYPIQQSLLS